MGVFDNLLNKFKKPKEEESKEPNKDVESQLGTTTSTVSSMNSFNGQLNQIIEEQNQFIQDLYGGDKAKQDVADIARRYEEMKKRRASKQKAQSVSIKQNEEELGKPEEEDLDTKYQEALAVMQAIMEDTTPMEVYPRMKSPEAINVKFFELARQARERMDRELGEQSNDKTSSKDGDKPPFDDWFTKAFE